MRDRAILWLIGSWVALTVPLSAADALSTDPGSILDWVQRAGIVGVLLLILVGGARRWWVFGYQYDAMQADRDFYRTLTMRLLNVVDRSVIVPPPVPRHGGNGHSTG